MSIVTDELKDDAKFLENLANHPIHVGEGAASKKLKRIAGDLENYASLMHSTSLLLEQRVEEAMDKYIRKTLDDPNNAFDPLILTLWLIVRALRSGASKALLGQGLASLGAGMVGSLMKDIGRSQPGVTPIDSDDK